MKSKLFSLFLILSFAAKSQTGTVILSGAGTDADGTISSYSWRRISGPVAGVINNPTSATTTVTGLIAGIYQFELTVIDNQGDKGLDTIQVTVLPGNIRPKANAGVDQTITLPTTGTTLKGSGIGTSVAWSQLSGPRTAIIASPYSYITTVTGLTLKGYYFFRLQSDTAQDDIRIQVKRRKFLGIF